MSKVIEQEMTKTFSVTVTYQIQIPKAHADQMVAQYREDGEEGRDYYQRVQPIAEALEEAIAWRSCEIVDAQVDDTELAAESFLEAMGVEDGE